MNHAAVRWAAVRWNASLCLGLLAMLSGVTPAFAADAAHSYPTMAPLSQYLMPDRNAEIALARSAAPASISQDAGILVLTSTGYVTAASGSNGFVCAVERSWMSPFDATQFWNAKLRGPICYNPQAVRSILPMTYLRTKFALAGQSREQIRHSIETALAHHQLPALEPGAMSYMLSKGGFLDDSAGHWMPHLMFYTPLQANWGADKTGSPVILSPQFKGAPEPINVYMLGMAKWSDGTPADAMP